MASRLSNPMLWLRVKGECRGSGPRALADLIVMRCEVVSTLFRRSLPETSSPAHVV